MSDDLALLKLQRLGEAAAEKQQSLDVAAQFKKQLFGPKEDFSQAPESIRRSTDPANYNSLADYEAAIGGYADPAIQYEFQRKLDQSVLAAGAKNQAEREAREATAWVKDSEFGTFTGEVKQTAANAVSGIANMASYLASVPSTVDAQGDLALVNDETRALYEKDRQYKAGMAELDKAKQDALLGSFTKGKSNLQETLDAIEARRASLSGLTEEEAKTLDSPLNIDGTDLKQLGGTQNEDGTVKTPRELLEASESKFQRAEAISNYYNEEGANAIVNPLRRDAFMRDISASYLDGKHHFTAAEEARDSGDFAKAGVEGVMGIAKLVVAGAGDIISNPAAAYEYMVENTPQLAVGAISPVLLGATNFAYGADVYQKGINEFSRQHGGRLPTTAESAEMLAWSMTASLAEQMGDLSILKAFKKTGVSDAVTSTITQVERTLAAKAAIGLVNNPATRAGAKTLKTALTEGATEGYQTAVEENLSQLKPGIDGEKVFTGAVIGAAAGGGMSAPGNVRGEVAPIIQQKAQDTLQKRAANQAKAARANAALSEAMQTGDIAPLLDPDKDTYDPTAAATALALRAADTERTEEERATDTEALKELVTLQEERVKEFDPQEEPEDPTGALEDVASLKSALETLPADDERRADIEAALTGLEAHLEFIDPKKRAARQAQEEKHLGLVRALAEKSLGEESAAVIAADPEALMEQATSEATPENAEAPTKLVSLMMKSPDAFDGDMQKLEALAQSDRFTPEQQTYLRAFTEARIKANALKTEAEVTSNILKGDRKTGFKGLTQYVSDVGRLLRQDDTKGAREQIQMLQKFYNDHAEKERAARTGLKYAQANNATLYLVKEESGWKLKKKKPDGWVRGANGGLEIHENSGGFINTMGLENAAIKATGHQLRASLQVGRISPDGAAATSSTPRVEEGSPAPVQDNNNTPPALEDGDPGTGGEPTQPTSQPEAKPAKAADTKPEPELVPEADELNPPPPTDDDYGDIGEYTDDGTDVPDYAFDSLETPTEAPAAIPDIDYKESTADNPLVREARNSVRKALVAMNFQFVDAEGAPDVTDIERIASKILSGTSNDDPAFLKDAAHALSYALFQELGATERSTATREWVEHALYQWLNTGKEPTAKDKTGVWLKVLAAYNRLMSFFKSQEYEAIQARLEKKIQDIRTGSAHFTFTPKEGFHKLAFQSEMDNNPNAVRVLLALQKAGLKFSLTGSVAYADQVPVYRKTGKPLHDVDLLMDEESISTAQEILSSGEFGIGTELYSFKPQGRTVIGVAVVPKGYEIKNVKSGWRPKTNAVYRSYEVFDQATGEQVGKYSYEANSHETFEGIAGISVDLMSAGEVDTVPQPFTADGQHHTIQVANYVHGFAKKLQMLRYKDIHDYLAVIPPKKQTPIQNESEGQEPVFEDDVPFPGEEEEAADDTPERAIRVGGFYINVAAQDENGEAIAWRIFDGPNFYLEVEAAEDENGNTLYLNVDNENETWDTWEDLVTDLEYISEQLKHGEATGYLNLPKVEGEPLPGVLPAGKFKLTNLIANYFRQRKVGKGAVPNALLQHKDLLSSLFDQDGNINEAMAETVLSEQQLSPEQRAHLKTFALVARQGNAMLREDLQGAPRNKNGQPVKEKGEYTFRNFMDFFRQFDENGNELPLEENLLTGMSYAAFSWMVENAGGTGVNSEQSIRSLLNLKKDDVVLSYKRKALLYAGTRQDQVIQALGNKAYSALGFEPLPDTPESEIVRLKLALGSATLGMMQQGGLVKHHKVSERIFRTTKQEAAALMEDELPETAHDVDLRGHNFIQVVYKNAPLRQSIVEGSRNTKGILSNLFSVETSKIPPRLKPSTKEQERIKNTAQGVPTRAKKISKKVNKEAWFILPRGRSARQALAREALQKILGWKDLSLRLMHRDLEAAYLVKNSDTLRDMENLDIFEDDVTDEDFFFTNKMWSVQRNGLREKLVNPQTSHYHRGALAKRGWKATFDPTQESATRDNFLLAVAQGLGIKIDKQHHAKSLDDVSIALNDPTITAAIDAVRQIPFLEDGTKLSDEQQAAIVAATEKTGMHGFNSLVEYGAYLDTPPGDTFETYISLEVDGVSNGIALVSSQLGYITDILGASVGMISEHQDMEGFSDFRNQPGAQDLYEQTVTDVRNILTDSARFPVQYMTPVYHFMGPVEADEGGVHEDARNLVKYPILMMLYGGFIDNNIENMGVAFTDTFAQKIEDQANGPGTPAENLADIVESIRLVNIMLPDAHQLASPDTVEEALQISLSAYQRKSMAYHFTASFGQAVKQAMETRFAAMDELRSILNRGAETAFENYNAAREALIKHTLNELRKKEEIDFRTVTPTVYDKKGVATKGDPEHRALQSLSPSQLAEIDKILEPIKPVMHTWLSQQDGDLSTGLDVTKVTSAPVDSEDWAYAQKVNFRKAVPSDMRNRNSASRRNIEGKGTRQVLAAPGVRLMPVAIQSTDSAISMLAAEQVPMMNAHDAGIFGISGVGKGAHAFNKATFTVLSEYSIPLAVLDMVDRSFAGQAALIKEYSFLEPIFQDVTIKGSYGKRILPDPNSTALAKAAYIAEAKKLTFLLGLKIIDQYTFEGGQYYLTAQDRLKLEQRLSELRAEYVRRFPKQEPAPKKEASTKPITGQPTPAPVSATPTTTPTTTIVPTIPQDADLDRMEQELGNLLLELRKLNARNSPREADRRAELEEQIAIAEQVIKDYQNGVTPTPTPKPVTPRDTPWGVVGQSRLASNPTLEKYLQGKPVVSGLVKLLLQELAADTTLHPRFRDAQIILIKQLLKTLPGDMPIRYITPETVLEPGEEAIADAKTSYGWYTAPEGGGAGRLNIKSSEFQHSGIVPGMLAHELLHAAAFTSIARMENITREEAGADAAVWDAVQELKELMGDVNEFLSANPELAQKPRNANAMANLQEFVAYGLTSQEFMLEVMVKAPRRSKPNDTVQRVKESGVTRFVNAVSKMLFGSLYKDKVRETTVLGAMISNMGIIFDAERNAQQQEETSQKQTHSFMKASTPSFTTRQIFNALGNMPTHTNVGPAFRLHLEGLITNVVTAVYGNNPVIRNEALRTAPATAEDVYLQALASQSVPFASKLSVLLPMDHQSSFTAEAVEVSLRAAMNGSPTTQHEIRRIWDQAKKALKGNPALTQAQYDLIFTPEVDAEGHTNYLSQFMAASLTYPPLFEALQQIRTGEIEGSLREGNLGKRIALVFAKILNALSHWFSNTRTGQSGGDALKALAGRLAAIEQKRISMLERRTDTTGNVLGKLVDATQKVGEKARTKVGKAADAIQAKTDNTVIQAATGVVGTLAGNRVEQMWEVLYSIRDGIDNERYGVIASVINEARGVRDVNEIAHMLLDTANAHEQKRKKAMLRMSSTIRDGFVKKLKEKESIAMTRVGLRLDLQSLMNDYSLDQITQMIRDQQMVEREIKKREQELKASPHYDYYLNQAKALGWNLARGDVTIRNMMRNTSNIAFLVNTTSQNTVSENDGNAIAQKLDSLVSLYGLKYTEVSLRKTAHEVAVREANRPVDADGVKPDGFLQLLLIHKRLQTEARETLFAGDEYHMQKGYTKDIFDPHVDLVAADSRDGAMFEQAGYVQVAQQDLERDPADPTPDARKIYAVRGKGLNSAVLGFMSNTGERIQGFTLHGDVIHENGQINRKNQAINNRISQQAAAGIQALFQGGDAFDPSTATNKRYTVPVLNNQGQAVNYRYLMSEDTKDNVLNRDNRVEQVMGHVAGSIVDKAAVPAANKRGIDALYQQYQETYIREPGAFIEVSETSSDPEVRERYRLLPKETRAYAKQKWGTDKIMVRKDTYDLAFGYRKYSLYDPFTVSPEQRNFMESLLVMLLGEVVLKDDKGNVTGRMGSKRALAMLKMENAWQEIVKEVKDIIVIKNLWTLVGNEMSNFSLLALAGVPLLDIVKYKITAYQATSAYQKADEAHARIKTQLESGYIVGGTRQELQNRLVELEDEMQRNPVRVLVDAGMFQTLVEDISTEEDPYSYKSRLTKVVDKYTGAESDNRVIKDARTVGKNLLMTHDTGLYKLLNKATILSDFTSRYVLHEYLTTRKKNPLSSHEALMQARAAFVNYDVPTHRGVQYLNDMGLVWFTKYYLRIQGVIYNTVRENPVGVLSLLGLQELVGGFSDILDSSLTSRWPVNVGAGALEYPFVLNELLTAQALGL